LLSLSLHFKEKVTGNFPMMYTLSANIKPNKMLEVSSLDRN